jgi:glycyl-tRNA synthetase
LKLNIEGKEFALTEQMVAFEAQTKTHHEEKYIPNVIEPSFGIGRVLYCIFEHCFKSRESDA